MNVLRFTNHAEMQAYLIQAQADADSAMHQNQRALTFGDHWVRFYDLANGLIEFGRIATLQEVADHAIDNGATAEEAAEEVDDAEARERVGYMTGQAFSKLSVNGEWGHTHKSVVWPIESALFHQAAECEWKIDFLPTSAKINLEIAFRAQRAHARGEGF